MASDDIFFNGDEIVARYVRGKTRYLLITFMGAFHESEAESRYLLKEFVEENNVSCVGISTKMRGFYLGPEMEQVLERIAGIRAQFSSVIVIGLSMGGYAAIKYSSALRADHVVAFSAHYSVDPDELALTDELAALRERVIIESDLEHRPQYRGMSPKPHDVAGSIFVVYDARDAIDRLAATHFGERLPRVTAIPLTHVGHMTSAAYFNQIVMFKLIDVLLTGTPSDVRKVFISVARSKASYAVSALRAAARRKPRMVFRAILSPRLSDSGSQEALRDSDLAGQLMYEFARQGASDSVRDVLDWALKGKNNTASGQSHADAPDRTSIDTSVALLLTCHGHLVFFDTVTRKLLQRPGMTSRASLRPLGLVSSGGDQLSGIYVNSDEEIPVSLDVDIAGPYLLEPADTAGFSVISGRTADGAQRYMCADASGRIGLHAGAVSEWERFVLLPVDRRYLRHQSATVDGWLDKALARSAASPAIERNTGSKPFRSITRLWTNLAWRGRQGQETPTRS